MYVFTLNGVFTYGNRKKVRKPKDLRTDLIQISQYCSFKESSFSSSLIRSFRRFSLSLVAGKNGRSRGLGNRPRMNWQITL
jgi:hypothetical protein